MTERGYEKRSASALSHADRLTLALSAARWYVDFSSGVTRRWICSVAGFLTGGLPLGRFVMGQIIAYTNNPCKPSLGMI